MHWHWINHCILHPFVMNLISLTLFIPYSILLLYFICKHYICHTLKSKAEGFISIKMFWCVIKLKSALVETVPYCPFLDFENQLPVSCPVWLNLAPQTNSLYSLVMLHIVIPFSYIVSSKTAISSYNPYFYNKSSMRYYSYDEMQLKYHTQISFLEQDSNIMPISLSLHWDFLFSP